MRSLNIECKSCKGTGLYKGACEKGASAVICHVCKGTGENIFMYNEFTGRKTRDDVKRVFSGSFGYLHSDEDVVIEDEKVIRFSEGGCTYEDWLRGEKPKPVKDLYCPHLYKNEGMGNEPLDRCREGLEPIGSITNCKFYSDKRVCWNLVGEGWWKNGNN